LFREGPKIYEEQLKKAWWQFIKTGYINRNLIRMEIAESWLRCRSMGVNPFGGKGKDVLTKKELAERLAFNERLVKMARPLMKNLYALVEGSGFVVILVDKDGYLLEVIGDPDVMRNASELNFIRGVNWSEKEVGTNAIGTALEIDKPIQVVGAEHYCQLHHPWTCSAAPIRDPKGRLIGVLNMSGESFRVHPHTLGMVVAAVHSIENQLRVEQAAENLIELNEYLKATMESMSDGMLAISKEGVITHINSTLSRLLGTTPQHIVGMHYSRVVKWDFKFEEILNSGQGYVDREMILGDGEGKVRFAVTSKPIRDSYGNIKGVVTTLRDIHRVHKLVNRMVAAQAIYTFEDIIGESRTIKEVVELGKIYARSNSNLLIRGESGTGKELFAQAIHNASMRTGGPFIAVNCAAIPRDLIESELFGYEEGAFTGAKKQGHPGKFELANGGTILLDEIGDMPLELQGKLLRVLQEREVTRVGGIRPIPVDVRVISATNKDIGLEIKNKNFREDLYYRLNVLSLHIPPLRQRKEDIPILIKFFLKKIAKKYPEMDYTDISEEAMEKLMNHDWPGNVRELENVIERAVHLSRGKTIMIDHLPDNIVGNDNFNAPKEERQDVMPLKEIERKTIKKALCSSGKNITKAAKMLKIGRSTLYRKMKKYKINL